MTCRMNAGVYLLLLLVYNRYETHFGEEQARLSRDSRIIEEQEQELQWTKPVLSRLSLGSFPYYMKNFDSMFVDSVVYGSVWESFMSKSLASWRESIALSFALLL